MHKNEIIFHCLILISIINNRSVLERSGKCKENRKYECRNIIHNVYTYVSINNLRRPESRMIED